MKQVITLLALGGITIMASCNSGAIKEKEAALVASQYTIDSMKMEMVRKQVIDSMNEMARMQFVIPHAMAPAVQELAETPKAVAKKKTTAKKPIAKAKKTTRKSTANRTRSASSSGGGDGYAQTTPVYEPAPVYQEAPAPAPQKKGWSAKAKGAVIGAGAGAIGGAVINKRNRAAGAVIGGVLGAGAGTGIGAIIDKKNGR